jgi:adenylosuccinate lyase
MAGPHARQHALPVTFGCEVRDWLDELMRHRERCWRAGRASSVGEWAAPSATLAALGRTGSASSSGSCATSASGVPRVPSRPPGDRYAEFFLLLAMLSATLGKDRPARLQPAVTDVDEVSEFVEGKVGSPRCRTS